MFKSLKFFATYSWLFLAFNLYVILGGAFVRATGSGAGCGDHWPLCQGEVIPHFGTWHTIVEFTHRISSGAVALGSFFLCFFAFSSTTQNHPVRKSAIAVVAFVLLEALLGAGLVLFGLVADNSSLLRAFVTCLHLVSTFLLLASIALTAAWASGFPAPTFDCKASKLILPLILVLVLILTGASGAITALGDTLFKPKYVGEHLLSDLTSADHFLKSLRIYHPILAIFSGLFTVFLAFFWTDQNAPLLQKRLCFLLAFLFVIQIAFGFLNIFLLAPVWMQMIHLLFADVTWISVVLFLSVFLSRRPNLK